MGFFSSVKNGLKSAASAVGSAASSVASAAVDTAKDVGSAISSTTSSIISGTKTVINSIDLPGPSDVVSWVTDSKEEERKAAEAKELVAKIAAETAAAIAAAQQKILEIQEKERKEEEERRLLESYVVRLETAITTQLNIYLNTPQRGNEAGAEALYTSINANNDSSNSIYQSALADTTEDTAFESAAAASCKSIQASSEQYLKNLKAMLPHSKMLYDESLQKFNYVTSSDQKKQSVVVLSTKPVINDKTSLNDLNFFISNFKDVRAVLLDGESPQSFNNRMINAFQTIEGMYNRIVHLDYASSLLVEEIKTRTGLAVALEKQREDERAARIAQKRISTSNKVDQVSIEQGLGAFFLNAPNILFVCDYVVDNKKIGCLVAWEKYSTSTHYEIYKRNVLENQQFYRFLFAGKNDFRKESKYYWDYLRKYFGFNQAKLNSLYVIFDDEIEEDFVYEYKVKAFQYPDKISKIDYDFCLESKNLIVERDISNSSTSTLYDMAQSLFGNRDLAWCICALNESVPFFGVDSSKKSLVSYLSVEKTPGSKSYIIAKNNNDIVRLFNESLLFDSDDSGTEAVNHFLRVLGGLSEEFRTAFVNSIDKGESFSFDTFIKLVIDSSIYLDKPLGPTDQAEVTSESSFANVSKLIKGSENLRSIVGLSKILKIVNLIYMISISGEDRNSLVAYNEYVKQLEEEITKNPSVFVSTQTIEQQINTVGSTSQVVANPIVEPVTLTASKVGKTTQEEIVSTERTANDRILNLLESFGSSKDIVRDNIKSTVGKLKVR